MQAGTFSPVVHPGAHTLLWLDASVLQQRTGIVGVGTDNSRESAIIAEAIGKSIRVWCVDLLWH